MKKIKNQNIIVSYNSDGLPSLDTNTKLVRHQLQEMRSIVYGIKYLAGEIKTQEEIINDVPRSRVSMCGNTLGINKDTEISLAYTKHNKNAVVSGVHKCGSVWRCPVCSYKISRQRQIELYRLFIAAQSVGIRMSFITFTIRHDKKHSLASSINVLNESFRKMQRNRNFRNNIAPFYFGLCKAMEITYGANGWHPHLHVLYFHNSNIEEQQQESFCKNICSEFFNQKEVKNRGTRLKNQVWKIVDNSQDLANYISKWDSSKEIASANFKTTFQTKKGGYTPFGLLRACRARIKGFDMRAVYKLFSEYASVTKGKHHLHISKGLKDFGRLFDIMITSDREVLDVNVEADEILYKLPVALWRRIYFRGHIPELLNLIESCENNQEAKKKVFYYLKDNGYLLQRKVNIGSYDELILLDDLYLKKEDFLKKNLNYVNSGGGIYANV